MSDVTIGDTTDSWDAGILLHDRVMKYLQSNIK